METMTTQIQYRFDNKYNDVEMPRFSLFRQHMRDNLVQLRNTAEVIYLSEIEAIDYKYRLTKYLTEEHAVNHSLMWFIFEMNDIASDREFVNIQVVKIPSKNELERVYSLFKAYNSRLEKNELQITTSKK